MWITFYQIDFFGKWFLNIRKICFFLWGGKTIFSCRNNGKSKPQQQYDVIKWRDFVEKMGGAFIILFFFFFLFFGKKDLNKKKRKDKKRLINNNFIREGKNRAKDAIFPSCFVCLLLFCFVLFFHFRISSGCSNFEWPSWLHISFYSFLSSFFFFFVRLKKKHTHLYGWNVFTEREKGHENSIRLFLEIRSLAPCSFFFNIWKNLLFRF